MPNNIQQYSEDDFRPAGLSSAEAIRRLAEFGANEVEINGPLSKILRASFCSLPLYAALSAAVLSAVAGYRAQSAFILSATLLRSAFNAIRAGWLETCVYRQSVLTRPKAKALRDGVVSLIPASELVVGDIVLLEAGDDVPADMRIVENNSLETEETDVGREYTDPDRYDRGVSGKTDGMVYYGECVIYGSGKGLVTATGMRTVVGAATAHAPTEPEMPFSTTLSRLWHPVIFAVAAIATALISYIAGASVLDSLILCAALLACIPERFDKSVSFALCGVMNTLTSSGIALRRPRALEALSSLTALCCGDEHSAASLTLTELRTRDERKMLNALASSGKARLCLDGSELGNALDAAVLRFLLNHGAYERHHLHKREISAPPFDPDSGLSCAVEPKGKGYIIYVSGPLDELSKRCIINRHFKSELESATMNADKTVAYAYKELNGAQLANPLDYGYGLTMLGLAGFKAESTDSGRDTVAELESCGVRTLLISAERPETALSMAASLGLRGDYMSRYELEMLDPAWSRNEISGVSVFPDASGSAKERVVRLLQSGGDTAAVCGGIQELQALKSADISLCSGSCDLVRNSCDLVIPGFAASTGAVLAGRRFADTVRLTVLYLISCSAGLFCAALTAVAAGQMPSAAALIWLQLPLTLSAPLIFNIRRSYRRAPIRGKLFTARGLFAACAAAIPAVFAAAASFLLLPSGLLAAFILGIAQALSVLLFSKPR